MSRLPSFRSLAAAVEPTVASMSHRPYFRGAGPRDTIRYYSDQVSGQGGGNYSESVSGDSHFSAIRDANRGYRPGFRAFPRPRPSAAGQQFDNSRGPRQWVKGSFNNHAQFRAPQPPRRRPFKPPDYREWDYAKPGPPDDCERFTVLSYNILADYLATDHWQNLYSHIPQNIMHWNWRKRNIMFELGLWSADILCFQEVDRFQDILDELTPHGYTGIWKMRTGNAVDGCALLWRLSRFKLVHEESIEYCKLGLRDNVAQICVLQSLNDKVVRNCASSPSTSSESSNKVVICNIHVLFNPKRGDIKLGQIRVLLARAHSISRLWDNAPIVICGDFNSTPTSSIYNFITNQKLDLSCLARDEVSGQVTPQKQRSSRPPYPNLGGQDAVNICGASVNDFEKGGADVSLDVPAVHGFTTSISSSHLKATLSDSTANENLDELSRDSFPYESISVDFSMAEELSLDNQLVDCGTDGLHENSGSFPSIVNDAAEGPFPSDLASSSLNQELDSSGVEITTESSHAESEMVAGPSTCAQWTPVEIEAATGNADCNFVEHPLKLTSAYSKVEDSLGIRDSCGEPLVTSYHRRFCGTVDYIWICDGLQPTKVLSPIPKHVMLQTRGFPTRKWGSDHIALVTELAFTRDASSGDSTE